MITIRRLYLAIVAGASLGMLIVGLATLGSALIEWLPDPGAFERTFRQTLAMSGALALVGLPLWVLHWAGLQRFANRDPAERSSAIRRLYLYLVAASLMLTIGILAYQLVDHIVSRLLGTSSGDFARVLATAWQLAVALAFWTYHFKIAADDRAAAGETGASATLRRWYAYAAVLLAFSALLFGARDLVRIVAFNFMRADLVGTGGLGTAMAQTLVALAIWLFHGRWVSRGAVGDEDRGSTLRAVAGFGIVALTVALVLAEASQALYYALARLLGVEAPGGIRGDLASILVGPASTILVFGAGWALMRRSLMVDASVAEAPRQAGVRRLYAHLVALLSLAALATGVAGLLWTLSDLTFGPVAPADAWRNQVSLFVTMIVVGLPVWLAHWRPAPARPERLAFSRRLYVFAAILVAVLAFLGSGAYLVYRVLNLLLGVDVGSPATEIGRAFSVAIVALAVAGYHWRALRLDGAERALEATSGVQEPLSAPRPQVLLVQIVGASEAEVQSALAHLPAQARWSLRAEAQ